MKIIVVIEDMIGDALASRANLPFLILVRREGVKDVPTEVMPVNFTLAACIALVGGPIRA